MAKNRPIGKTDEIPGRGVQAHQGNYLKAKDKLEELPNGGKTSKLKAGSGVLQNRPALGWGNLLWGKTEGARETPSI